MPAEGAHGGWISPEKRLGPVTLSGLLPKSLFKDRALEPKY